MKKCLFSFLLLVISIYGNSQFYTPTNSGNDVVIKFQKYTTSLGANAGGGTGNDIYVGSSNQIDYVYLYSDATTDFGVCGGEACILPQVILASGLSGTLKAYYQTNNGSINNTTLASTNPNLNIGASTTLFPNYNDRFRIQVELTTSSGTYYSNVVTLYRERSVPTIQSMRIGTTTNSVFSLCDKNNYTFNTSNTSWPSLSSNESFNEVWTVGNKTAGTATDVSNPALQQTDLNADGVTDIYTNPYVKYKLNLAIDRYKYGTSTIFTTTCHSYITNQLKVLALPAVSIITGASSICGNGQTTTLSDSVSGGVWTSSNTGVATVGSSTGVVTSVGPGSTTISYTVTGANGCTKTVTKTFTVKSLTTSTTNYTICNNQLPYHWNGLTFSSAGSQTAHLTNAAGCDSAATLNLTVRDTTKSVTNKTICLNALPYFWNGLTFTSAGSQTAHLTNAAGCDSAAQLNLDVTICDTIVGCEDSCNWSKTGNHNIDAAKHFIGTVNAADFVIKTTNTTRVVIPAAGIADAPGLLPMLLIDPSTGVVYKSHNSLTSRTANPPSQSEIEALQDKVKRLEEQTLELQLQVKALLEARNYSPCTVVKPGNSTLEIVPTPFADNAKAIYSIDNFSGEATLQVADMNGKVLKTFAINQAKGQVDIGMITSATSTIVFNIVSSGKVLVTKKSIKVTD